MCGSYSHAEGASLEKQRFIVVVEISRNNASLSNVRARVSLRIAVLKLAAVAVLDIKRPQVVSAKREKSEYLWAVLRSILVAGCRGLSVQKSLLHIFRASHMLHAERSKLMAGTKAILLIRLMAV